MSSKVKTLTPFINRDILCLALMIIDCGYVVKGNTIITERTDYYGKQKFELINGRYSYIHESNAGRWGTDVDKSVQEFLSRLEKEYNAVYLQQAEEERRRLEEERRAYVEKQRQTVIANAKAQGYYVQEKRVENKIKLVLVRTTY